MPLAKCTDAEHRRWGHLRPMTAIVSGLLPLHPNLHITFFVHASFADLVEAEITRYKLPRDDRARLHCVRFGDQARSYLSPPQNVPKLAQEVMENAKTSYPRVLKVSIHMISMVSCK